MNDSVLVVGAGPTGLALACGLASAGVDVRVIDAAAQPSITSRALGLQPRGAEVLDRCGALGDLEERSRPIKRVLLDVGGTQVARLDMGRASRLVTRPGLIISQAEVEGSLRERLSELGHQVEWGRTVCGLVQRAGGVDVALADGEVRPYGWVIGCDGAHSTVRRLAGIGFPGVPLVERFVLADVVADLPVTAEAVSVWLRGEELLAAFPLPGSNRWRLMATARGSLTARPTEPQLVATVTHRLHAWTGWPETVVGAVDWTSTFSIQRRLADRYRVGRVLLAGDAAHIHSPFGGQGMNTGLGDAENLAWKLALVVRGQADAGLLDTYEAERRPVAADVLAATSGLTRVILGDSRLSRFLRDRVFVPALNRRAVQRLIADRASQLQVSYRRGPLGRSGPLWVPRRGTQPGDRVPDLRCTRTDASSTRLYAELRRGWALLLPFDGGSDERTRPWATLATVRLGSTGLAVLRCAENRDVRLVRPDGHLAWRGTVPGALETWLSDAVRRQSHTSGDSPPGGVYARSPHGLRRLETRRRSDG